MDFNNCGLEFAVSERAVLGVEEPAHEAKSPKAHSLPLTLDALEVSVHAGRAFTAKRDTPFGLRGAMNTYGARPLFFAHQQIRQNGLEAVTESMHDRLGDGQTVLKAQNRVLAHANPCGKVPQGQPARFAKMFDASADDASGRIHIVNTRPSNDWHASFYSSKGNALRAKMGQNFVQES